MVEVNSWLTGRRGVSLPFADHCAPLCSDKEAFNRLLEAVIGLGKRRNWRYLEMRGGRSLFDEALPATSFYGHQLDLSTGAQALFGGFSDSVRRAIRKAEKSGVSIEFTRDIKSVRVFHELLCLTRKRHGVPPQPFSFFKQIHQHILAPGKGWVVIARHQGRPVAGAVFFHFGQAALYKFGASDETQQNLRANNLIMARSIEWHAQNNFTSFDFGRTSQHNEGLRNFKLGWGAKESQIEYVRIAPQNSEFLSAPDKDGGFSQRLFNHLPLPVSRLIGNLLYRHAA